MSPSGAAALKVTEAVPVFAALGDATRLSLLGRLSADGPLSITRLSEGTGVTRQAITRHLYALGDAGLVRHARRGRSGCELDCLQRPVLHLVDCRAVDEAAPAVEGVVEDH
jgi:DNA-binding transcriptional ArsR family regulator